MTVNFQGLRNEDPFRELKVTGWGNLAQEMVDQLKNGQKFYLTEFKKRDGPYY